MFKRMMVVLVAVLLLNVGVAGAGTAGMTGLWSFDGMVWDAGGYTTFGTQLTGEFSFTVASINLVGTFFGSDFPITGSINDLGAGYYGTNDLVWSWYGNMGDSGLQCWEITDLGNGTASVESQKIIWFGSPTDPPQYVIEGTLTSAVPLPGAFWLVGAGLFGLGGMKRRSGKAIQ